MIMASRLRWGDLPAEGNVVLELAVGAESAASGLRLLACLEWYVSDVTVGNSITADALVLPNSYIPIQLKWNEMPQEV